MTRPLVSVVIPTYRRPVLLRHAIASVERQSYPHVEIIVMDDDGIGRQGPGWCRHEGAQRAHGQYVAFLDDDDLLTRHYLHNAVAILEDGIFDMVHCDALMIDERGASLTPTLDTFNTRQASIYGYRFPYGRRTVRDIFVNPTLGSGFVVRKSVFARVPYPSNWMLEDYRFLLDVAGAGFHVCYWPYSGASYRIHQGNRSQSGREMAELTVKLLLEMREKYSLSGWAVRKRMAQAWMDLGISYVKAGKPADAARALWNTFAEYPPQSFQLGKIGLRKAKQCLG
jgi:glycosyltransferase involved in cell wall biosynthesis